MLIEIGEPPAFGRSLPDAGQTAVLPLQYAGPAAVRRLNDEERIAGEKRIANLERSAEFRQAMTPAIDQPPGLCQIAFMQCCPDAAFLALQEAREESRGNRRVIGQLRMADQWIANVGCHLGRIATDQLRIERCTAQMRQPA